MSPSTAVKRSAAPSAALSLLVLLATPILTALNGEGVVGAAEAVGLKAHFSGLDRDNNDRLVEAHGMQPEAAGFLQAKAKVETEVQSSWVNVGEWILLSPGIYKGSTFDSGLLIRRGSDKQRVKPGKSNKYKFKVWHDDRVKMEKNTSTNLYRLSFARTGEFFGMESSGKSEIKYHSTFHSGEQHGRVMEFKVRRNGTWYSNPVVSITAQVAGTEKVLVCGDDKDICNGRHLDSNTQRLKEAKWHVIQRLDSNNIKNMPDAPKKDALMIGNRNYENGLMTTGYIQPAYYPISFDHRDNMRNHGFTWEATKVAPDTFTLTYWGNAPATKDVAIRNTTLKGAVFKEECLHVGDYRGTKVTKAEFRLHGYKSEGYWRIEIRNGPNKNKGLWADYYVITQPHYIARIEGKKDNKKDNFVVFRALRDTIGDVLKLTDSDNLQ